jgi:hypothetical protein
MFHCLAPDEPSRGWQKERTFGSLGIELTELLCEQTPATPLRHLDCGYHFTRNPVYPKHNYRRNSLETCP